MYLKVAKRINMFLSLFIYFERERASTWAGEGQRERERESQAGSLLSAQSLMPGLNSRTARSWAEPKSRVGCLTNWATQAPHKNIYLFLRERDRGGEGQRERERESQGGSRLSAQNPMWGLIPWPWDHNLNRNHELDTQPTKTPRCPYFYCF